MTAVTAGQATASDPENTMMMEISNGGTITMEMMPDKAPQHVERIKKLAREGFYNGVTFHRVIDGFMAQTGDPTGTGTGGSSYPDLPAEFSDYTYKRGTVGMARTSDPNSANSQFFICFNDTGCKGLTGQYTVVGQVTSGMESVDKIAKGEPPASPDKITKMTVASDMGTPAAAAATETTPATTPAMTETPATPAETATDEGTKEGSIEPAAEGTPMDSEADMGTAEPAKTE